MLELGMAENAQNQALGRPREHCVSKLDHLKTNYKEIVGGRGSIGGNASCANITAELQVRWYLFTTL